ncbi:MAG TPA: thiamine pyrophosphate-dependent enzyme [Streptosporangiaceae bacterium]
MADEHGLDQDRLVWMFTQMLRIREFEERAKRSFTELPGLLRGHTHLADGAEASIVGSLAALRPGDQILTTYRCRGYPIVLGTDPKAMMAEIFGKRTGLCGATAGRCTSLTWRGASWAPPASWGRGYRRRPGPPTPRKSPGRARS